MKILVLASSVLCVAHAASASTPAAVDNINDLGMALFHQLAPSYSKSNLLYSPLSVANAVMMIEAGASGETAWQLTRLLPSSDSSLSELQSLRGSNDGQFDIADAAFVRNGLPVERAFSDTLFKEFGARERSLDLSHNPEDARETVNQWVSDRTHAKISHLFAHGTITSTTGIVLADAIYLQQPWLQGFDINKTTRQSFRVNARKSVQAPTMHLSKSLAYFASADFAVLELESKNHNFALDVVLPTTASPNFARFETGLTAARVSVAVENLKRRFVNVALPKFRIDTSLDLVPVLEELGLTLPFDSNADFSKIDGSHDLSIGRLQHEAVIDVDESGATAAAATAGSMLMGPSPPNFTANHPFVIVIRDRKTGAFLFVGHVRNPVE